MQIATIFRAHIIDVGARTVTLQVTGPSGKIDALEGLLRPYGIRELYRTGRIAILRGQKTVRSEK
jgi:acetolactate synthase-1/3 small subunit